MTEKFRILDKQGITFSVMTDDRSIVLIPLISEIPKGTLKTIMSVHDLTGMLHGMFIRESVASITNGTGVVTFKL